MESFVNEWITPGERVGMLNFKLLGCPPCMMQAYASNLGALHTEFVAETSEALLRDQGLNLSNQRSFLKT